MTQREGPKLHRKKCRGYQQSPSHSLSGLQQKGVAGGTGQTSPPLIAVESCDYKVFQKGHRLPMGLMSHHLAIYHLSVSARDLNVSIWMVTCVDVIARSLMAEWQ